MVWTEEVLLECHLDLILTFTALLVSLNLAECGLILKWKQSETGGGRGAPASINQHPSSHRHSLHTYTHTHTHTPIPTHSHIYHLYSHTSHIFSWSYIYPIYSLTHIYRERNCNRRRCLQFSFLYCPLGVGRVFYSFAEILFLLLKNIQFAEILCWENMQIIIQFGEILFCFWKLYSSVKYFFVFEKYSLLKYFAEREYAALCVWWTPIYE